MFPGQATTPQRSEAGGRQAQASANRSTHIFIRRAGDPRAWTQPPSGERRSRDHDSSSENTDPRRRLEGNLFPPIDSRVSADVLPRLTSRGGWGGGMKGWNGNTDEGCKSWILRTGTRASDLTDPSELLRMKTADPVAECRGGGRRRGGALEGSRSNRRSARARSPRVAPLSRSSVGEDGGSQQRWNQRFIQHGERSLGSASRSDYIGRRPIRCRGALTSP